MAVGEAGAGDAGEEGEAGDGGGAEANLKTKCSSWRTTLSRVFLFKYSYCNFNLNTPSFIVHSMYV